MAIVPRNARKLKVTFKVETSAHKAGDTTTITKNRWGCWSDGKYAYLVSMLRNKNVCEVQVLN